MNMQVVFNHARPDTARPPGLGLDPGGYDGASPRARNVN